MTQRIKLLLISGLLIGTSLVGAATVVADTTVFALDPTKAATDGFKAAGGGATGQRNAGDTIKLVINVLLFIVGSLSVIMIIFGGIRYVISNGESAQITAAKNTIMYAVIGLTVALLSYAIANFIVTQFS